MAPNYLQIVPRGPQSRFSHFLEISKNWPWPPMQGQIPHLEFFSWSLIWKFFKSSKKLSGIWYFGQFWPNVHIIGFPAHCAQLAEWWTFEKWKWPQIMKTWYFHQVKSLFDLKQAAIRIKTDFGSRLHPLEVRVFHENIEILWFLACDTPGHLSKGWYELELTFCSLLSYWCWIYSKKGFLAWFR